MSENSRANLKITLPGSLSGGMKGAVSRGVKAAQVDADGHLILTLTDNSSLDLGNVHGVDVTGIEQTASSSESGGENVICVTLSDGSSGSFTVKNGGRGAAGPSGVHYGSDEPQEQDVLIWLDPSGEQQLYSVTEESISGGHSISFITPTQTKTVDIMDGAAGEKGAKGDTGAPGAAGSKGDTGVAGYSPVRGTDYWTAADIAAIKGYVDDAILGGAW